MAKRLVRWASGTGVMAVGIFALAGRWLDPWLWAYLGVWCVTTLYAMWILDDDLAQERFRPPEPGADKLSLRIVRLIALAHVVAGALDIRWQISDVPSWLRVAGLAGMGVSFALFFRAMAVNHFFSAVVRIQKERGHRVVDRGPYAIVRHPGYAAMIPAVPCSGLALGSWLAVAVGLVYSGLILRRAIFEDSFLKANLEGYRAYADRVRYRLVPGLF